MDRQSLSVSPVAELIVKIAEQRESCSLQLADRGLRIVAGELVEVSAADSDLDFAEFLVRSGRLRREQSDALQARCAAEGRDLIALLRSEQLLPEVELKAQHRALWLERVTRALRKQGLGPLPADGQSALPADYAPGFMRARLLPILLDALSRLALDTDAAEIGRRLPQRLSFVERAALPEAKRWASFGEQSEKPVVAALLSKLPACAPYIAALLRAGLAVLEAPSVLRPASPLPAPTLPPPPSRFSRLPLINWSTKPSATFAAVSSRRVRLEPGGAGDRIDVIPDVSATSWPKRVSPLADPLREPELELTEEPDSARRTQIFTSLAELWEQRIGSLEEAARNLREAAATSPEDPGLLLAAAQACARIGHGEVALRYAHAALPLCSDPAQRAETQRLAAHLHERLEQHEEAVYCLNEAASEHAGEAWPHEWLAQLALERDQLPLAKAHVRAAASAERVRAPRRALAMYALAYGWDAGDTELASEYADALHALGHPEAAIAIVAQTARAGTGDSAVALLRNAASRAERHGRADWAAELWLELLALTPANSAAWDALEGCLTRPEDAAKLAAVLECRASRTPDAGERAKRLTRASRALDRFPDEQLTAARYARISQRTSNPEAPSPATGSDPDARSEAARVRGLARRADSEHEQQRLLRQLAALYAEAAEPRGVASACLELLALDASDPVATARLWLAAAQLSDAVARSEALSMLARVQSGSKRARSLALLAREQERLHDFDAALAAAEASLLIDATSADAVLSALGHLHHGTPERALSLLAQAQRSLAAPPAVLLSIADAAAAAGDGALVRRSLAELLQWLPHHAPARCMQLESLLSSDDAAGIETCARELLTRGSSVQLDRLGHEAMRRLAELDEYAAAAGLAEQLLARHGRLDPELADYAYELSHVSGQGALQIRALERAASAHSGAARAACLFQLATRHSAAADRVAELRALLRAAALPEGRVRALEQLSARFAELGDLDRLLTVMSLRLDATSDAGARRRLLFDMACATVHFAGDRARALGFARSMLVESIGDRTALLHGLGTVFALGDASWALSAARELALEQNPDVAGALFLWLAHKAELNESGHELALSLALEGAERYPATGELLVMAERLTLARGDKSGALALYAALLAGSSGAHGQRALHYRAGRWLERFGAPLEALDHYQLAFDLAPSAGVAYAALLRCARSTGKIEVLLSAQHNLSLLATSDRQRTTLLSAAVDTALRELHDPARALSLLLEAEAFIPIGELDALLLEAARAANLSECEGMLRELITLRAERIEQLWDRDAKADALLALARLQAGACSEPGAAAATLRGLLDGELSQQLSAANLEQARDDYSRLSEQTSPAKPSAQPPDAAPPANLDLQSEEELHERAQRGDAEALATLVQRLGTDPAYEEEAFALLAQLVRCEPQRTAALRDLTERAQRAGASAQARICEQILSLFDARYPAHPRVAFGSRELPPEDLWQLLSPERDASLSRLLQLIWQHARLLPQLRPAARFEALGDAATPSDERAIVSAFARVTSLLGRSEAVLHVKSNVAQDVSALPGPPATLVVRAGLTDAASLEFQLARALVACDPEHAVVTALNERAARRLFTAVTLAFGAPNPQTPLSLSDRALALQLRATISKPTQTELRQLVATHEAQLDYARLRKSAELAAVRAGLLVSGDVRTSLLSLARMQSSLNECDVETETGYARACVESPTFAALVRCALSLPFIGLTELALPQRWEESAE